MYGQTGAGKTYSMLGSHKYTTQDDSGDQYSLHIDSISKTNEPSLTSARKPNFNNDNNNNNNNNNH